MSRHKAKASKAMVLLRLREILRIRLEGAKEWDVSEYVHEQERIDGSPWKLDEGETPMSGRQIRRYIRRADRIIEESTRASRKRSITWHLARREAMYAKAMNAGDVRTALAVADSEAKLRGLFPVEQHKLKVKGAPMSLTILERVVGREDPAPTPSALTNIVEVVVTHDNTHTSTTGNPPPPGATGVPQE
jgi:hypothetical protein